MARPRAVAPIRDRRGLLYGSSVVALLIACGSSDGGGGAATGEERGPCYPNGTCNSGLSCLSGVCVVAPDAAAPDATVSDVTPPAPVDAGGGDSAAGDSGVDSGGVDCGAALTLDAGTACLSIFDPSTSDQVVAWYRADQGVELEGDGGCAPRVTAWRDQSPSHRDAISPSAAHSPTFVAASTMPGGATGSLPWLSFDPGTTDGSLDGDRLDVASPFPEPIPSQNETLVIVAAVARHGSKTLSYVLGNGTAQNYHGVHFGFRDNATLTFDLFGEGVDSRTTALTTGYQATAIYGGLLTLVGASGGTQVWAGFSGGGGTMSPSNTGGGLQETTGGAIGRGYAAPGLNDYFDGAIGEIVIYRVPTLIPLDSPPPASQYLACRWGIK